MKIKYLIALSGLYLGCGNAIEQSREAVHEDQNFRSVQDSTTQRSHDDGQTLLHEEEENLDLVRKRRPVDVDTGFERGGGYYRGAVHPGGARARGWDGESPYQGAYQRGGGRYQGAVHPGGAYYRQNGYYDRSGYFHDASGYYDCEIDVYELDIKPILEDNCIGCHNDEGSMPDIDLTTFKSVYNYRFAIVRQVLAGSMPPSGELDESTRKSFLAWRHGGFLRGDRGWEMCADY